MLAHLGHRWKIDDRDTYGTHLKFLVVELGHYPLLMRLKTKTNEFYLYGNFIVGCPRDRTFSVDGALLRPLKNHRIGYDGTNEYLYHCFGCTSTRSEGIQIYTEAGDRSKSFSEGRYRIALAQMEFTDQYVDRVGLLELEKGWFMYVHTSHTYGHSNGALYALDQDALKLTKVHLQDRKGKIPDSLSVRKGFGLSWEDGEFRTGAFLRSEVKGMGYGITTRYELVINDQDQFELRPMETILEQSN